MSPEQRQLVRDTWQQVGPIADTASALFYDRLFEIDPDIRTLFRHADMAGQRRKLVAAIGTVVDEIDRIDALIPMIAALGRRHAGYGVTDAHYDTVGAALLWTLEKGLGDAWTPAVGRRLDRRLHDDRRRHAVSGRFRTRNRQPRPLEAPASRNPTFKET